MNKLAIRLENCYGIREFEHQFDFTEGRAFAIYAPNGSMKTSFADTFADLVDGKQSVDRIFRNRVTKRFVKDEVGTDLQPSNIVVIEPFDPNLHMEDQAALLLNSKLKDEYQTLCAQLESPKAGLLKVLCDKSGIKKDVDKVFSSTITGAPDRFYEALIQLRELVDKQKDAPFASVPYQVLFNETVLKFLESPDVRKNLQEYAQRYNILIGKSAYFKKGVFEYHHATNIANQLDSQGFFDANHTVFLNSTGNPGKPINNKTELIRLIAEEQDAITNDDELRKQFAKLSDKSTKNETLREFRDYILKNSGIIPHLLNPDALKRDVWRSYLKENIHLYAELMTQYDSIEKRKDEIKDEAAKEITKWDEVISEFNDKFIVPFRLAPKNKAAVILKDEPILSLAFVFQDPAGTENVERDALLVALSQGEKKAYYVLNIMFDVAIRRENGIETLFIIDDLADSFDYKNKYAIIEYLNEMTDVNCFRLLILTHNFDFYRTLMMRQVVLRKNCLMAYKTDAKVSLEQPEGLRNVFVKRWKPCFATDNKMRIASIAFMRNLIEFKDGFDHKDYETLTSLLHYKTNSETITQGELDGIYNNLFNEKKAFPAPTQSVLDMIRREAELCLNASAGINFEHKIVLSIAIRLAADKYMLAKMPGIQGFPKNQTARLVEQFVLVFPLEAETIRTLRKVVLMTPEGIHLNSFMYEPILDMNDELLRELYRRVNRLK